MEAVLRRGVTVMHWWIDEKIKWIDKLQKEIEKMEAVLKRCVTVMHWIIEKE